MVFYAFSKRNLCCTTLYLVLVFPTGSYKAQTVYRISTYPLVFFTNCHDECVYSYNELLQSKANTVGKHLSENIEIHRKVHNLCVLCNIVNTTHNFAYTFRGIHTVLGCTVHIVKYCRTTVAISICSSCVCSKERCVHVQYVDCGVAVRCDQIGDGRPKGRCVGEGALWLNQTLRCWRHSAPSHTLSLSL